MYAIALRLEWLILNEKRIAKRQEKTHFSRPQAAAASLRRGLQTVQTKLQERCQITLLHGGGSYKQDCRSQHPPVADKPCEWSRSLTRRPSECASQHLFHSSPERNAGGRGLPQGDSWKGKISDDPSNPDGQSEQARSSQSVVGQTHSVSPPWFFELCRILAVCGGTSRSSCGRHVGSR